MKTQLKSLLLVTLFAGILFPQRLLAQASTEGKEFWVALTPSQAPEPGKNNPTDEADKFGPYIAISAQKKTTVKISNPNTGWSITKSVGDNSWTEIRDIPREQWYDYTSLPTAESAKNLGLKVESINEKEKISVFCALRWRESFDASNILPVTALGSEYIIQSYQADSSANSFNGMARNVFTILAIENCTVEITTPSAVTTSSGRNNFQVPLNAGQVYHVYSQKNQDLSGTRVKEKNGHPIAIFAGAPTDRIPNISSDRDLLYEQLFPTEYWGTHFIVTRSMQRDANRVKIIAQEDDTEISIYGTFQQSAESATTYNADSFKIKIQSGETYEFELSAGYDANFGSHRKNDLKGITILDSTVYISTSCPCAVISYDTGNSYKRNNGTSEFVQKTIEGNTKNCGAPAMTWISPIEQMIDDVVFGVMGTKETTYHFVNIIAKTQDIGSLMLNGNSIASRFRLVESNKEYSYARIKLEETEEKDQPNNPFYHLYGADFIATVYGNGFNESYAYSVGSAAISREIQINKESFKSGDHTTAVQNAPTFCIADSLEFKPNDMDGSIYKVVWNFGDGTAYRETTTAPFKYAYNSPGWYDAQAIVYGKEHCNHPAFSDTILMTFRVVRPDTLDETIVLCASDFPYTFMGKTFNMKDKNVDEVIKDTVQDDDCSNVYRLTIQALGQKNKDIDLDTVYTQEQRQDRALIPGDDRGNSPEYVYTSGTYTRTYNRKNSTCDSVVNYSVTIIKCLDFKVDEDNPKKEYTACRNESADIPYSHDRDGNAGDAFFEFTIGDSRDTIPVTLTQLKDDGISRVSGSIDLPLKDIEPGHYNGVFKVFDLNCNNNDGTPQLAISDTITISVLYPSDIFKAKFGNSLSVYNPGYGGNKIDPDKKDGDANNGWKFIDYQWYKDDQKIDSLTAQDPLYYTPYNDEGRHIKLEGVYYVELTREDGVKLKSCSQTFIDGKHPETKPAPAAQDEEQNDSASSNAAQKVLQNRQIRILRDGHAYNIYGQKVD